MNETKIWHASNKEIRKLGISDGDIIKLKIFCKLTETQHRADLQQLLHEDGLADKPRKKRGKFLTRKINLSWEHGEYLRSKKGGGL